MIFELSECEEIIGYKFKDLELFRTCFTHSSYTNEHPWQKDNERLEFFGDKIIDFVVTEYLYTTYEGANEGELTERRKNIVSKEPLTEVVFSLGLNKYINLGRSLQGKSDKTEKLYSSLYEAIVAGIYIDGGLQKAKEFIFRTLLKNKKTVKKEEKTVLSEKTVEEVKPKKDAKSELQEYVQKNKLGVISYKQLLKTGPDNNPEFTEQVFLNDTALAQGKGKNRKQAQQSSALVALSVLKNKTKKAEEKPSTVKNGSNKEGKVKNEQKQAKNPLVKLENEQKNAEKKPVADKGKNKNKFFKKKKKSNEQK